MITEIRGGNNVKRFHTTYRAQEETVGQHSANVAALLLRLDPSCSRNLLICALMHDIPEQYTGDVPAPFKWDHPDIKSGLAEGEQAYMAKHDIPYPELTLAEAKLLKVADMVDLVLSSMEEWGRGNESARDLIDNGAAHLAGMDLSEDLKAVIHGMVTEVKVKWRLMTGK